MAGALHADGRRLLPCLAWHDSTHIASVDYYRRYESKASIVSNPAPTRLAADRGIRSVPISAPACAPASLFATEMSTLGFIESGLGPRQSADVLALGVPAYLAKWRTWVLDDGENVPMVGHLDGSAVRPSLDALAAVHGSEAGRRWRPAA